MVFSAESFVNNAETFLPAVEMLAKITGMKIVSSIASVLRRAVQYPDTRAQLIAWLKWTPLFGKAPNATDPQVPDSFSDLQEQLDDFKAACDLCDG